MTTLEDKIRNAEKAIAAFTRATGQRLDSDGADTVLIDLLTDLQHWWDARGDRRKTFGDVLSDARWHHNMDVSETDRVPR